MKDSNVRTAARFLALTIHHIDNLLEDWYPGLDSINIYGESLVNRLIPCSKCLRRIITTATVTSSKPKNIPSNDHWPNSHKSVFYFNTPPNSPQIHSTPLSSKNGIISPSSGSDSSFGFENESGFAVTDSDAISRESSPASSVDNHDGNGYEQQSSDTDTDDFSTSSATSGVQSSPQHRGSFDEKLIATFSFEECVVRSQTSDHVYCLIDGKLFFREEAPDVVSWIYHVLSTFYLKITSMVHTTKNISLNITFCINITKHMRLALEGEAYHTYSNSENPSSRNKMSVLMG